MIRTLQLRFTVIFYALFILKYGHFFNWFTNSSVRPLLCQRYAKLDSELSAVFLKFLNFWWIHEGVYQVGWRDSRKFFCLFCYILSGRFENSYSCCCYRSCRVCWLSFFFFFVLIIQWLKTIFSCSILLSIFLRRNLPVDSVKICNDRSGQIK